MGLSGRISTLITTDPGWPWPGRFAGLEGIPVKTLEIYSADQGFKLTGAQLEAAIEPGSLIYVIDPLNPLGSCCTRLRTGSDRCGRARQSFARRA